MSLEKYIENLLPAGSGINGEYTIEVKKDKIIVKNSWDNMNENGFYDDVFKFSITYRINGNMSLHFHGLSRNEYRKIENNGLRDYLETLYYELIPAMIGILNNNIPVYENNIDIESLEPLERGFLGTMVQDAIYNFADNTPEHIPEPIYDNVNNYPFTVKNIDEVSLKKSLDVIKDISKDLPEHIDKFDLGGELYLAACYGETENTLAKEIANNEKYRYFSDATKEIIYDNTGKYMIFVE